MKEIYMLCNAHLDPVWLWQREEGKWRIMGGCRFDKTKNYILNVVMKQGGVLLGRCTTLYIFKLSTPFQHYMHASNIPGSSAEDFN